MNVFTNMKVTTKLLLLLIVMVSGFVAVGVTYVAVLNTQETALAKAQKTTQFQERLAEAELDIGKAATHQRDFLLNKQLEDLERFEAATSKVREALGELEDEAPSRQLKQLIAPVGETLDTFHAAVYQLAQTRIAVGLDKDSGLHGDIRHAAQELEEALTALRGKGLKDDKLITSLLLLRRHEKDYLQGADDLYVTRMAEERETFMKRLGQTGLSSDQKATLGELLAAYQDVFDEVVEATSQLQRDRIDVATAFAAIDPALETMVEATKEEAAANLAALEAQRKRLTAVFIIVLLVTVVVVALIMFFLSRGITNPLQRLQATVQQVSEGDMTARAQLKHGDEIGALANAFDSLLDERVAQLAETEREREARLAEAEHENEVLNTSVVSLLQAVAKLSQRDLTVKVPVAEDVTGPVSDALNLLAAETANVLGQVTRISDDVASASRSVKSQSDAVVILASREREQVTQTSDQLAAAAETMSDIAARAQTCNTTAENAIQKTQAALETVTRTASGINDTRDTIRETEKRIKRLGERSQEISGVVNLINNIAERTHILALNASMHAASAGEAGRGFAVVADEVQRLAENARQATEQIASLVSNIQTETMDTVTTMNTVISQVVEGSRLAEQAGEQMRETQQTTAELVASVQQIAEGSQMQATVSNELRNRASEIVESTFQTSQQLEEQGIQTSQLLDYASRLVETVRVFTLPDQQAEPDAETKSVAASESVTEKEDWPVVING